MNCLPPTDLGAYSLQSGEKFLNQRYAFVLNCPPGYVCHGYKKRTITIDPGVLPPIIIPNDPNSPISLPCCSSTISQYLPPNATRGDINDTVGRLFGACARQLADCLNISTGPPGLPPPTLIPTGPTIVVGNDEQCITIDHGVCESPEVQKEPVTVCIPANTYTRQLISPSPAAVQAAKAQLNNEAVVQASTQAESQVVCGYYNETNTYSSGCGCSPNCGFHGPYSVTIDAGIYFSTVSQADANHLSFCGACAQLQSLCVADGCPPSWCQSARDACGC